MPLFQRPDGTIVKDLPAVRRVMPYIMRCRNECSVYLETRCDVTSAKKWLWAYNQALEGQGSCTFLHLFLYAGREVLKEFPHLDRFVAGRRIYQRKESTFSLMVKETMDVDAPLHAAKLPMAEPDESLRAYSQRIESLTQNARDYHERSEKETQLLLLLPDFLVRFVLMLRNWLDDWGILPLSLIHDDPLYTSIFISNIGSLGLPEGFHHLYEHGNCSAFAMISALQKCPVADWDGNITIRDILPIRWTVDDRVADGFICAQALKKFKAILEDPGQFYGPPDVAAQA